MNFDLLEAVKVLLFLRYYACGRWKWIKKKMYFVLLIFCVYNGLIELTHYIIGIARTQMTKINRRGDA